MQNKHILTNMINLFSNKFRTHEEKRGRKTGNHKLQAKFM